MRRLLTTTALAVGLMSPSTSYSAELYNETLDGGIEAIFISGDIVEGDEEKFRELSIQFPDALVGLDSEGGQLVPALEIGRLIRLRGYDTVVLSDHTCASSCALIWMGGSRRTLQPDARLGFHASYYDDRGRRVESGAANALIGRYLTQLNYSEDAVLFATLASPDEIWWLDESTRAEAGIDYVLHDPDPEPLASPPPPINITTPTPAPSPPPTLRAMLRREGMADAAATSIGATGNLHAALSNHIGELYANDALMERVEAEMAAAKLDLTSPSELGGALLFRLSTKLMMNGLSRLPQKDVNRFFSYLTFVVQSEGPNCEVSLANEGKVSLQEYRIVETLGDKHLREYMALLRKAVFAEASQSSPRIDLDEAQATLAQSAFDETLLERMADTGFSEERFLDGMAGFDAPSEENRADRCAVTKLMMDVTGDMEGMTGDWMRRLYITYMQEGT